MDPGSEDRERSYAVHRVPVEILVAIFIAYKEVLRAEDVPHNPGSFLVFTEVCKYWRQIVNCSKLLWTDVFLPAPEQLVIRSLELSGGLPLDPAFSSGTASTGQDVWSTVLLELPRFRHVTIDCAESPATCHLELISVPSTAPFLQSITVSDPESSWLHPCLLKSINEAPHLCVLDIVTYPDLWVDVAKFTALRTLIVRRKQGIRPDLSLDNVMDGLRPLRRLEELHLSCELISVRTNSQPSPPVVLPRLKRLVFTGPSYSTGLLLGDLDFPRSVRVVADEVEIPSAPGPATLRLHSAAAHLLKPSVSKLVGEEKLSFLDLAAGDDDVVTVRAFSHEYFNLGPRFAVKLKRFAILMNKIPLGGVRSVSISGTRTHRATAIKKFVCRSLSRLETLTLRGGSLRWLKSVLQDHHAPVQFATTLRTLVLVDFTFAKACPCEDGRQDCAHQLEQLLSMYGSIAGRPLFELRIVRCEISDQQKDGLRPLVQVLNETTHG